MLSIEEIFKQSLVCILELQSIETRIKQKLEQDLKDYDNPNIIMTKTRKYYLEDKLKGYKILIENLEDYIKNPTKVYFPEGINYG
jgi:hypothetical protein